MRPAETKPDSVVPRSAWLLPFVPVLVAYVAGLFVPVMEVDAAQYASISREMAQTGNYLQLYHRGVDYLDKPPLLFWLSAGLFQLIGVSTWAYKLPSLLAAILGIHAVGKFAEQWYGMRAGWTAALVLASSVALLLHTNDVRTDTLLMAWIAVALWQFGRYLLPGNGHPRAALVWGWLAVGLAMLTKGPIGLMAPVLAIGTHLLVTRNLRVLLRLDIWLIGLAIVPLVLAPMLVGLYQQYGWEGWYFYFWKQSFGRLTGENVWRDDSGPFFFAHTFLWLFLPWAFAALWGLWQQVRAIVQRRAPEGFSFGGALLPALALSLSQYKLPHYLLVCLPMAAVLTAVALRPALEGNTRQQRIWAWVLGIQVVLLIVVGGLLAAWAFPLEERWWVLLPVLAVAAWGIWAKYRPGPERPYRALIVETSAWMAALFLLLNLHLYPALLQYQSATQAGVIYHEQAQPRAPLVFLNVHAQAVDWEARGLFPVVSGARLDTLRRQTELWIYAPQRDTDSLLATGLRPDTLIRLPHYHITRLTPKFVNPARRPETLEWRYLMRLRP